MMYNLILMIILYYINILNKKRVLFIYIYIYSNAIKYFNYYLLILFVFNLFHKI